VDAIITTEKDSVRLPRIAKCRVPIYFLRVEIEILTGHESWQHCVDRICKPQQMIPPEKFFA
jgi:tetraacyldisaccharide 4'-kinase